MRSPVTKECRGFEILQNLRECLVTPLAVFAFWLEEAVIKDWGKALPPPSP